MGLLSFLTKLINKQDKKTAEGAESTAAEEMGAVDQERAGENEVKDSQPVVQTDLQSESVVDDEPQEESAEMFRYDKASWQWDSAYECFCEQTGFDGEADLTDEQEAIIWAYAGNHMAVFLTWAIMRGFVGELHLEENAEAVAAVKNKTMSGIDFFVDFCDCVLSREDFSPDIYDFVDAYYDQKYLTDYSDFWCDVLHKEILGTSFSWEDYSAFEHVLDEAYANFKAGM